MSCGRDGTFIVGYATNFLIELKSIFPDSEFQNISIILE